MQRLRHFTERACRENRFVGKCNQGTCGANKITSNPEVFENSFLMRFPTEKELSKAKDLLGYDIPNEYVWFLKTYGHGGFFFEFLGYGINDNAIANF